MVLLDVLSAIPNQRLAQSNKQLASFLRGLQY